VNAFVKWKGVIEAGSYAEDIIRISYLFTTFARLGNTMDGVPRDRVIDGIDQTSVLLLGDAHGRRDYVHIYEGTVLKSVVKNKYKMHLAPEGANPVTDAFFYDLYRDPGESRPMDSIKYGPWACGQFAGMIKRHMAFKKNNIRTDRLLMPGPMKGLRTSGPKARSWLRSLCWGYRRNRVLICT